MPREVRIQLGSFWPFFPHVCALGFLLLLVSVSEKWIAWQIAALVLIGLGCMTCVATRRELSFRTLNYWFLALLLLLGLAVFSPIDLRFRDAGRIAVRILPVEYDVGRRPLRSLREETKEGVDYILIDGHGGGNPLRYCILVDYP